MKKEEATSLLKEIAVDCGKLEEKVVMLVPPNPDDVLSDGYQLKIQADLKNESLLCIKAIAKKHGLAITHEPVKHMFVLYRPVGNKLLQTK